MVANIPLVFYLFPGCILCSGGEPGTCAVGRDHREGNAVADDLRPRVTTFGRGVLFQQKMRPAKQGTATRISFEKGAYRSFGDADQDVSIVSNIF